MSIELTKIDFWTVGSHHKHFPTSYKLNTEDVGDKLMVKSRSFDSSVLTIDTGGLDPVPVDNGWDTRRLSFKMEFRSVKYGSSFLTILNGYTDHLGVDSNGVLDPYMKLYINSRMVFLRCDDRWELCDSSQVIIPGPYIAPPNAGHKKLLSPLHVLQALEIKTTFELQSVTDWRASIGLGCRLSDRRNAVLNLYLDRLVEGLITPQLLPSTKPGELLRGSIALLREAEVGNCEVFNLIDEQCGVIEFGFLKMKDLFKIFPHANQVINFTNPTGEELVSSDYISNTEPFGMNNPSEKVAHLLTNAVTTISSFNLVRAIELDIIFNKSENKCEVNVLSEMVSVSNSVPLNPKGEEFILKNVKNFVSSCLKDYCEKEIKATIKLDTYRDTVIEIDIDAGGSLSYAMGSFADALFSPVVGDEESVNALTKLPEVLLSGLNG